MDRVQRELFGSFPRRVGNPSQFFVHSEGQFDIFLEENNTANNCYTTISSFTPTGRVICDKVFFDFDSPTKDDVFTDVEGEHRKVQMMRNDPDVADDVLGEVCEDVSLLASEMAKTDVPLVGVFTGLGVHVHQLYQPEREPIKKISTTGWKCKEELDLETVDTVIFGNEVCLTRIPNCERMHVEGVLDSKTSIGTGLYTIPLTEEELVEITPSQLLDLSKQQRRIDLSYIGERPEMRMFEEYEDKRDDKQVRSIDTDFKEYHDDEFAEYVKRLLKMPCMYERVLQPNPEHLIRQNLAVMLFNLGFDKESAHEFIRRLNWRDYNRKITSYMLNQIYNRGYGDKSCRTMQKDNFCTRKENPESCPTYGWSGGICEWKE